MANTKKLSRDERKQAKRVSRKNLVKLYENLTLKQRKEFRKAGKGIKAFIGELEKKSE